MKAQTAKSIAVDDSQYLMVNEFIAPCKGNGLSEVHRHCKISGGLMKSVEMFPNELP